MDITPAVTRGPCGENVFWPRKAFAESFLRTADLGSDVYPVGFLSYKLIQPPGGTLIKFRFFNFRLSIWNANVLGC